MSAAMQPFARRADPLQGPAKEQFRADLNVRLVCPDCQDDNVQLVEEFASGDLVCGGCGKSSRPGAWSSHYVKRSCLYLPERCTIQVLSSVTGS